MDDRRSGRTEAARQFCDQSFRAGFRLLPPGSRGNLDEGVVVVGGVHMVISTPNCLEHSTSPNPPVSMFQGPGRATDQRVKAMGW